MVFNSAFHIHGYEKAEGVVVPVMRLLPPLYM